MADELDDLRARVREWLRANLPPAPPFALPQNALTVESDEQLAWLRAWQARLYDAGFVGAEWPAQYGGRGVARGAQRAIDQELARAGAPFLVNNVALAWAGPMILRYGTEAQRARFLAKLLRADEIWCQGFSEPGSGSDLASLRTRAVRDGDAYVIDGHKVWTSLGRFADYMILLARTDPNAVKHAGISYFLAPMRVPGVEVRPLVKVTGEAGFNQVIFTNARIPADALLGREGQGWELATATLSFERGASEGSAGASGMGGAGFGELLALLRSAPPALRGDGAVRDRFAALAIEATALRYDAARARVPGLVADRPQALPLMAKLTGTEHAQRLADFGLDLLGADASLWKDASAPGAGEWAHSYLGSFAGTIAGGTSEILRNVLGERVLGLAKSR
ncbi:MAG TPA: acyl-CoA dehydrogenase family protein [Myxococcota bacterium]|nr:acyl-CoA dehydrogenase family protein [Myxococcota bacterium]